MGGSQEKKPIADRFNFLSIGFQVAFSFSRFPLQVIPFSASVSLSFQKSKGLLKNAHLLRFPYPSSLRRTSKYASFLRISGALHLRIFEQPAKNDFFSNC